MISVVQVFGAAVGILSVLLICAWLLSSLDGGRKRARVGTAKVARSLNAVMPTDHSEEKEMPPSDFFPLSTYLSLLPHVKDEEELSHLQAAAFSRRKEVFLLEKPHETVQHLLEKERRLTMGEEAWQAWQEAEARRQEEEKIALALARAEKEKKRLAAEAAKSKSAADAALEAERTLALLKNKQVRTPYGRNGHEVVRWPSEKRHTTTRGLTRCGKTFSLDKNSHYYGEVVEGRPPCKACEKEVMLDKKKLEVETLLKDGGGK